MCVILLNLRCLIQKYSDTKLGIEYYICIISIPVIFNSNFTTNRLLYITIFSAVMAYSYISQVIICA